MSEVRISLVVNGEKVSALVEPRVSLADFLRQALDLTGTHVRLRARRLRRHHPAGRRTRARLLRTGRAADNRNVRTIEGMEGDLQSVRCSRFSTSAMRCNAVLLAGHAPDRARAAAGKPASFARRHSQFLSGNYCRCTGYQAIVDAVEKVAGQKDAPA